MRVLEIIVNGWYFLVDLVTGIYNRIATVLGAVWSWIFRLRKVFMALPVVYQALMLAEYNRQNLPEMVGFDIQASGEFAQMISRETAVMGPLALTLGCLVLMFCSRRTVYPWIISIFTLVLPILILVLNQNFV